jgi:hypothetical protein
MARRVRAMVAELVHDIRLQRGGQGTGATGRGARDLDGVSVSRAAISTVRAGLDRVPARGRTDLYIDSGRIGEWQLLSGCYTWHEALRLAAVELWRRGEADAARVKLKAGRQTVGAFLRVRFGIISGAREYWHRENWTPDRVDLQDLLRALRKTRTVAGRAG